MDKHDNYNLLDYSKTLYESNRHGEPYCRVGVSLDGGELTVWRFDFEEWEYNRRTGIVESSYSLDLLKHSSILLLHSKNIIPLPSSRR